jgi:predicted NAD-dependent protein-ADP-ribosyltransferase YbiA (DUF1768 family)
MFNILQALGCWFHYHREGTCLSENTKKKHKKLLEERRMRTEQRELFIKKQGYRIVNIWECHFKEMKRDKSNVVLNKLIKESLPSFYQQKPGKCSVNELLEAVKNGTLFGMIETDIRVPSELHSKFAEMSPLFCNVEVGANDCGQFMKQHMVENKLNLKPRRMLVGGMTARKILLASPLLAWYLQQGLEVTKIYQVIEFVSKKCFKEFQESTTAARRMGDLHPNMKILGDSKKLLSNSSYGGLLLRKEKHSLITYTSSENDTSRIVNSKYFRNLIPLHNNIMEVESGKKKIVCDLPSYLAFFVLQYAKLALLKFYYQVLDKYIDRSDFEMLEIDTDSIYFAHTGNNLIDIIKPHLKQEFRNKIYNNCSDQVEVTPENDFFLARQCCEKHLAFDNRTPGLCKIEAEGVKMICLSSKTYFLKTDQHNFKLSAKGVNKSLLGNCLDKFDSVLNTQKSQSSINRGFRVHNHEMHTYEMSKNAFMFLYMKRRVHEDGIHTSPLDLVLCPWGEDNSFYFWNEQHVLSPLHRSPLERYGLVFSSIEHLFQYERAIVYEDKDLREKAVTNISARLLRKFKNVLPFKQQWVKTMDERLRSIMKLKILALPECKNCLKSNKNKRFVYAYESDKYLGCGLEYDAAIVTKPEFYPGQNKMGEIWNELSKELD